MASPSSKWRGFEFAAIALAVLVIFTEISASPVLSQYPCIGVGGWPCGYTGPFSGNYYGGYATVGCVPLVANGTCAVPQIAVETSYMVIINTSYVTHWANESFQFSSPLADGSAVSVWGRLSVIFYNKTAGSTYLIYYSNAKGLWNPQPGLQIENATLTTQPLTTTTCTTTLTFTVSGPPNGVWNLPMIPAGTCSTINNLSEQQSATAGQTGALFRVIVPISSGLALIVVGTLILMRKRRM